MRNKYLILITFSDFLGGAQIRYLSLFNEITNRNKDYTLVLNRKLYELAKRASLLSGKEKNIVILEIDQLKNTKKHATSIHTNYKKRKPFVRELKKRKNQWSEFFRLIKYAYSLHLVFKENKPEYVYAIWVGGMISWPLKYFHSFKLAYSFMDSGLSSIYKGFKHPLKNERLPLKKADIIDFLSESLYANVKQKIKLNKKTKIAISPCSFKDYSSIIPEKNKENKVVFCSRLTPIKNPMLFMRAVKEFNSNYSNSEKVKFEVLGDGSCMADLKKYQQANKLNNLILRGQVQNPYLYMNNAKVFVSIQQTNNYPSQSLLEAMACENAIIASDVGETRKLITKKEGVLVKLNAKEIASAIHKLLSNDALREEMGKNSRSKVLEEHTIQNFLDHFNSLETL